MDGSGDAVDDLLTTEANEPDASDLVKAAVASDDAQTPGFLDEVAKEIVLEAPPERHSRPSPGDFVTARVGEGALSDSDQFYSWTVGSAMASKTIAGVDLDRLVRTMRCGEQCTAFAKGAEDPKVLCVALAALERDEDLLADGTLLRTTLQDGTGWQTPRAMSKSTELKVRFAWRTVAGKRAYPDGQSGVDSPTCVVLLGGDGAVEAAASRELDSLRRALVWERPGVREVETRIEAGRAAPRGPVLKVEHGEDVLLDSSDGTAASDALSIIQARFSPAADLRRETREVTLRVDPAGYGMDGPEGQLVGEIHCSAEDWIPGAPGRIAVNDLRVKQSCIVRVQTELFAGLPEFFVKLPLGAALEYEVELLAIMTREDVSLDKSGSTIKTITKEGEGYEKPTEGVEVTLVCEALDAASGAVLVEERTLSFSAACGSYCTAIDETVLTMKKGELCELRCSVPSLCRDVALGLSPGESCEVIFHLEMKDFEKLNLYSIEELDRVAHCERRKDVGTKLLKDGDVLRALKRYQHVVSTLGSSEYWKNAEAKSKAIPLRRSSNMNASLCHLKLQAWRDVTKTCDVVLKEEPDNVKALFRRGSALKELGEYRDAELSLRRVIELDSENKEARALVVKLKEFVRAEVKQEKQMFSKMVAGGKKSSTDEPASPDKASSSKGLKPLRDASKVAKAPAQTPAFNSEVDDGADSCWYTVGAAVVLAGLMGGYLWSSGRIGVKGGR